MSQPTRACPTCQTPLPGVAAFCYVCGTETPVGVIKATGERVAVSRSGIGPADLRKKLQRALGPGYELQERIGAGGFAEVFKARDLRLKRDLAVKVLRPDLGLSPELVMRFRREAETIANLRHPHIVPVYDVGEAEGLAYLIMPLIVGESLRAVMEREGAMLPAEVQRILRETSSGLAAAHDAGIVHRDIKPENVMLEGPEKRALLMDFGIAKAVGGAADGEEDGDSDPSAALTSTGIIIGTPQYMSPEQACGDKSIDARSDQYSLAVVGYRMLSGSLPFDGESTRAVLYQQLVAEPTPLGQRMPDLPGPVVVAIQRAMSKEPSERFATMREFATMLDNSSTLNTGTVVAAPSSRRGMVLMSVAMVLALLGWYLSRPSGSESLAPAEALVIPTAASSLAAAGSDSAIPNPTMSARPTPGESRPAAAKGRTTQGPSDRSTTAATATPTRATEDPTARPGAEASCVRAADKSDWIGAAGACATEAASGSAVAQRILGSLYDRGAGVPADPVKAVEWYRKASVAGDLEAKLALSRLVEIGRGVAANQGESIALLREAAAGGLLRAQQTLAFRLENGGGIKKDEAESALWYRRAADQGDRTGMEKLADFLADGRGVTKNETEALSWFKKAAEQGSAQAAWRAAEAYFRGKGTAKDEAAGMVWLRQAAARNHGEAKKELEKRGG